MVSFISTMRKILITTFFITFSALSVIHSTEESTLRQETDISENVESEQKVEEIVPATSRRINKIVVKGTEYVDAVLSRVPYKEGEFFDPHKARKLIKLLYHGLKRFRHIKVMGKPIGRNLIDIHIVVVEKQPVKEFVLEGNNNLSAKDVKKEIDFSEIRFVDEEELGVLVLKLKKLYTTKNYHDVEIETEIERDEHDKATVTFNITEGPQTRIRYVLFEGNNNISSKELRRTIFTREDWALGFLDKAGTYQPDAIESDRMSLERYYQNFGYLSAKVADVDVNIDPKTKYTTVTFSIEEGKKYTINEVSVSGNDMLNEEYLLTRLPIQPDQVYSREKIMDSIKMLEELWGEFGYINANIEPSIVPDEEKQTINISFHTELGKQVFLNRINIVGNKKTRDKVIRRRLLLEEGCLLTNGAMERSKERIKGLGYFDTKEGVNWRVSRIDETRTDLDLMLKEIKTGKIHIKLNYGGRESSSSSGFSVGFGIEERNLFGRGLMLNLGGDVAVGEQNIVFNLTEPWLFDRPIHAAFDFYHRRPKYDEFENARAINERLTGGSLSSGIVTPIWGETHIIGRLGFDSLHYDKAPNAFGGGAVTNVAVAEYQNVLDQLFQEGDFFWFALHFLQDTKNHPLHASRGYRWVFASKTGIPTCADNIGFQKFDFDFHWYTSLIGDLDLVLHVHTYLGLVTEFRNKAIPYRELYNIGGANSVRGFNYGQVGPRWIKDPIGAKKAFYLNVELVFPITEDLNMKGVVFYDGGAGWDNPFANQIDKSRLVNNTFNYRHSVGIGIRMLSPVPIRIDWGFKLDPNKKLRETGSEVHFGMAYDF